MTLLVPFDGSPLAEAALSRAVRFSESLDEPLVAVSVIPQQNATYAREQGWLEADEPFEMDAVVAHLREQVAELAPEATFRLDLRRAHRSAHDATTALGRTGRRRGDPGLSYSDHEATSRGTATIPPTATAEPSTESGSANSAAYTPPQRTPSTGSPSSVTGRPTRDRSASP